MSPPRGPAALGILAALAAVAWVLQGPGSEQAGDPGASPAPAPAAREPDPRPLSPRGEIPRAPDVFRWTSRPGATAYRFELLGRDDVRLFERVTGDTTLRLPSGIVDWNIVAGATWRVTPITGATDGRPSAPVRFRIASP